MSDEVESIEFKYENTEDNLVLQMSGGLRGLKPLNRSKIIPRGVVDGVLTLEIVNLDRNFFTVGSTKLWLGLDEDCSRDDAFKLLQQTFSETRIWIKVGERKFFHEPGQPIKRDTEVRKMIVFIPVQTPEEYVGDAEAEFGEAAG